MFFISFSKAQRVKHWLIPDELIEVATKGAVASLNSVANLDPSAIEFVRARSSVKDLRASIMTLIGQVVDTRRSEILTRARNLYKRVKVEVRDFQFSPQYDAVAETKESVSGLFATIPHFFKGNYGPHDRRKLADEALNFHANLF